MCASTSEIVVPTIIATSSAYEVHDNQVEHDVGKNEVGKCSLRTDTELTLVSGVTLDT
jgi:hypothetical protein